MSFSDEMAAFGREVDADLAALLDGVGDALFESVVEGSPLTGAPGQPVGQGKNAGKLRDSWEKTRPDAHAVLISTDVDYAEDVEDNANNLQFRNHGPHSVKLTVAGFGRVVEAEVAKINSSGAR